jgi:hypothetical protein
LKTNIAKLVSLKTASREMFYRDVMRSLNECKINYLVGGGHAFEVHSGIHRRTKDLDLFVRPADIAITLEKLAQRSYETELCHPHWLAKVYCERDFIDLIFSSGNGLCQVDDGWFENALTGEVLGIPILFCPPEEMIWSKAFVMERERYDGADVAHLIRACATRLDWRRVQQRFGAHWRILLSHLILFGYIYPAEGGLIPSAIFGELFDRLRREQAEPIAPKQVCRGTLLSRIQFRDDVEAWGYGDARQQPEGPMTPEEAARWTDAGVKGEQ